MATQMTIAAIGGINQVSIDPGYRMDMEEIPIPGGTGQAFAVGVNPPDFTITGQIYESTVAASKNKWLQLVELCSNRNYFPLYIQFAANENVLNGWYDVASIGSMSRNKETFVKYPFQLYVRQRGTFGSHRLATWQNSAAETYSWGGATLTAKRLVSIPHTAGTTGDTQLESRSTSDAGNIPVLEDPPHATLLYAISATPSNWYIGECSVFDTITAGNTTESTWVRVYNISHVFTGDIVIQNGLLRYKFLSSSVTENWSIWDSGAAQAWKDAGQLVIQTTQVAKPGHVELLSISSEEIRWREIFQPTVNMTEVITATCSLRRGNYFCKYTVTAQNSVTLAVTGIQLSKTGGFAQLFNASVNGAGGLGNLATDANNNYHCGYNTTDQIVIGFVLLDKPTFQPTDTSTAILNESNSWAVAQQRTFFIIGWAQNTAVFVLATGRSNAAKVARECMYSIDQQLLPVSNGYFS